MFKNVMLTTINLAFILVSLSNCSKEDRIQSDIQEAGQQIGGLMASVDESSGNDSGTYALLKSNQKMFAKLNKPSLFESTLGSVLESVKPNKAYAASCGLSTTFSSCSSNSVTRDFGGCTVGALSFTGTVDLAFTDNGMHAR